MPGATDDGHHHRSTTKKSHKHFKSRHATKSSLRTQAKGKVEKGERRNNHQQMASKIERRNKLRQLKANKRKDLDRESRIFGGRRGAPRIVAVVPLCTDIVVSDVANKVCGSVDVAAELPEGGVATTHIDRFKQKLQWVLLPRELLAIIEGCKAADFVVFVLSANEEVDAFGETIIRSIETQAVSDAFTVVQHLDTVEPAKRRPDVKKSLLSFINHFFPTTSRVVDLDSQQETANLARSLCTSHPKGIHWRDQRPYLLAEEVRWDEETESFVVAGYVRGKGLKADRLVHIQGQGDFQIEKICAYPIQAPKAIDGMDTDMDGAPALELLDQPTEEQDDLISLAPEGEKNEMVDVDDAISEAPTNMTERRGVLLDEHHYFDDDVDTLNTPYTAPPQKLPKGTSKYQAAWFVDDEDYGSDSETSNVEDADMEPESAPRPEDGEEGHAPAMTEAGTEFGGDDAKSEMFLDNSPDQEAEQIRAFRSREKELEEDREFPDEIELEPNVLAHQRLARYRGLKSLRTSVWDKAEDLLHQPQDWERLAQISNYRGMQKKVLREGIIGGVAPGTRVLVYLRNGSEELVDSFKPGKFVLWGLLRHEHKQAVVNVSLTASTDYTGEPIKAKDELIVQIGPRRLHINPLFSSAGVGSNNVSKFSRYLIPGETTVATFVAPIAWGSVPAVFWKRGDGDNEWELVGHGTFLNADRERVVAKRIVLTGHPFKIHRKMVTVRYMFFNREDVEWFKAMPLFTKRGRGGFIKEGLGQHGYFKATFDGKINPQDAVAISLYKRVWPRGSTELGA